MTQHRIAAGIGAKCSKARSDLALKSKLAGAFKRAVCEDAVCWRCGSPGPLDAAHLIAAQTLRAHGSTLPDAERWAMVYDARLAVPLCREDHHLLDNYFWRPAHEDLPAVCIEAADEYGLGWYLERNFR